MSFGVGFAVGLVVGYALSLVSIRYFDRKSAPLEGSRPYVPSGVPYKRKVEKKKPVAKSEFKEWQMEQEQKQ